jgi:phenylalanyl-tRNA synthetase beta chain
MGRPDEPETIYNDKTVVIKNPLSQSESTLRPSLFVSLINNLAYNTRNFQPNVKAFEVGRVFSQNEAGAISESWRAGMIWSGVRSDSTTEKSATEVSLLEMKSAVEDVLKQVGIKKWQLTSCTEQPHLHPFRSFEIRVGKDLLAIVGEVHPRLLKPFHLRTRPIYMELFTESLAKYRSNKISFKPFSITPTVRRDISFWIDKNIAFSNVVDVIERTKAPYLKDVILCDIYDGKKHGEDKINWAISLVFQDENNALGEEQVNASFAPIIKAIQEKLPIIFA